MLRTQALDRKTELHQRAGLEILHEHIRPREHRAQ
jgi:hypothetical protein